MEVMARVEIHQYNDPEILEFFNAHQVDFRLVGDHLFVVQAGGRDVAVGPGDALVVTPNGEVRVEPGDYRRRAQRVIAHARRARSARRIRSARTGLVQATG